MPPPQPSTPRRPPRARPSLLSLLASVLQLAGVLLLISVAYHTSAVLGTATLALVLFLFGQFLDRLKG